MNMNPTQAMNIVLASRNAHKAQEIARMLPPGFTVRTLADYPALPEVEETGHTFADNAALKALAISAALPGLVLADDSGLCVDALGGAPGVLSARYAGEHGADADNNAKLLRELAARPGEAPFAARFVCAMCVASGGRELAAFEGRVEGHITLEPRGRNGFGYDPLFVPEGHERTMAELEAEEKNALSHRAHALEQVVAWLGDMAQASNC